MADATNELNRRRFLRTGLQATAGAAVLGTGIASAAAPKDKKVTLTGSMWRGRRDLLVTVCEHVFDRMRLNSRLNLVFMRP